MSLTNRQADSWSNQGAMDGSENTYNSIQRAIDSYDWPEDVSYDLFLQGSYRNSTNIRGDSDVDIVLQFNSTWRRNLSNLSEEEENKYKSDYQSAERGIQDLTDLALEALREYYSYFEVENGNKALKVDTPYLDADVVPSLQYRVYLQYEEKPGEYLEGIAIYADDLGQYLYNFPKLHYKKGAIKNKEVSYNFKPLVRIFKNARNHAVQEGYLMEDRAPSYFIECMMYNVPNRLYDNDYKFATDEILEWLDGVNLSDFENQHELHSLFGDGYEFWNTEDCKAYINSLKQVI